MLRCPKCDRFGVERRCELYQCIWRDCLWQDTVYTEPKINPNKFKKFRDSIKPKTKI